MTAIPVRCGAMSRSLTIEGVQIDDASDCYVIAEIGHNHQGSVEQAKVIRDLGLAKHGLRIVERPLSNFLPLSNDYLKVGGGQDATQREFARFSQRDAKALPHYWERLERIAQKENLDLKAFRCALDERSHGKEIERDVRDADKAGINWTPTFVVGSYAVNGAMAYPRLRRVVKLALRDQASKSVDTSAPRAPPP